jgi:hypothetical protein
MKVQPRARSPPCPGLGDVNRIRGRPGAAVRQAPTAPGFPSGIASSIPGRALSRLPCYSTPPVR